MSESVAAQLAEMTPRQRLAQLLFGSKTDAGLWFIVDTARDERLFPRLREAAAEEEIVPLYDGPPAIELAAVAPYLLRLPERTPLVSWLWSEGWGSGWGVWLHAPTDTEALRAHLRTLAMVRTEEGRTMMFRYYDPRVLAMLLPTCHPEQVKALFGLIESFFVEAAEGEAVERFDHRDGLLRQARLTLV